MYVAPLSVARVVPVPFRLIRGAVQGDAEADAVPVPRVPARVASVVRRG